MRDLKINRETNYTKKDQNLLQYYSELNKISRLLSIEEEVNLFNIINNSKSTKKEINNSKIKIFNANLRFVVSVAQQYHHMKGVEINDLINEGNIGLLKAIDRYEVERGFKFISYAVSWIRQAILEYISKFSRHVRLPLNKITKYREVNDTIKELQQKHEIRNVDSFLEDFYSEKEIDSYYTMNTTHDVSSLNVVYDDISGDISDTINSDTLNPLDLIINKEENSLLYKLIDNLSEEESFVVKHFYGLFGFVLLTKQEIADKMNIHYYWVDKYIKNGMRNLKNNLQK